MQGQNGRRLAAHVAASLRVAVPGENTKPFANLHRMDSLERVDFIAVIDGSNDGPANNPSRRLGAHAKTIMAVKTWGAIDDAEDNVNACFDFDLPTAWGITKIKAVQHSTSDGLYFSKNVAIEDLPDCVQDAASKPNPNDGRRRLDKHAGVCQKLDLPEPTSCLPSESGNGKASGSERLSASMALLGMLLMIFF